MIYSKNYDKKEIKLNFDASYELYPEQWDKDDIVKVLGDGDYPIDKSYKIID